MTGGYEHRGVERKWSARWEQERAHRVNLRRAARPYYNLMMFPYTSAEGLHLGNAYCYIGSDVHGRFMRAQGYDVFEPMGFDAFGIHSENYAMKTGVHPARVVPANIRRFRAQLERLGCMFDWSHEVNTTSPGYYRWTQWIFVQLHKAGLAYQKDAPVNWCPLCKTVLADEQARGGNCERCKSVVERRHMRQWFFRITAYAERLLRNLEWLDWSSMTRAAQRNWIGRSEGAEIRFRVAGSEDEIVVFTTRPDTLWGATYMVLAPEHPLGERICTPDSRERVRDYAGAAKRESATEQERVARDKSGVFTGAYAVNPASGQKIPIWLSDYVVMGYGSGAIMGVPAHDERDFEFAAQLGLPVLEVVSPDGEQHELGEAYVDEGVLVRSGPFSGMRSEEARWKIADWLAERDGGRRDVRYHLRDWCISRQRYWGPPIPIVHCKECGVVPVPEEELPVILPFVEEFQPDGSGKSPLARAEEFARTSCPRCGGEAARETDVSDNFLDSAWYFLRYPSSGRNDVPFDQELTEKWLPADMYVGGNEHAVLHLMYTRFITMALHDLGLIGFEEPFKRFRANGMITKDGAKISKSRGDAVNADDYIERFGADAFRTSLMFMAPYEQGCVFQESGFVGARRFVDRLWRYVTETELSDDPVTDPELLRLVHQKVKQVTDDVASLNYNTAISAVMELLNGLASGQKHFTGCARTLLQLASPFAPFVTQELWERIGGEGMICDMPWPKYEERFVRKNVVEIVVEVNGKVREKLTLPADTPQVEVESAALKSSRVRERTAGKEIVRTVFVPNKLLNIVIGERGG